MTVRYIEETPMSRAERELSQIKGKIRVELKILDPELANELLNQNSKNRKLRPVQVSRLQKAQSDGRWVFNAEPICVADTGRLLQGQHRCAMVVESGIPIVALIVTGLDESVFSTYDIGLRRSAADVLYIIGQTNCTSLGAALGWVERYENDAMTGKAMGVTPFSIQELLDEHGGLVESVKRVGTRNMPIRRSLMAALHYLFARVNRDSADKFLGDLESGVGLSRDDALYWLRERLNANARAKAKLPADEVAALAIKAWNFRRRGMACKNLRWRSGGDQAESFPRIEGLQE